MSPRRNSNISLHRRLMVFAVAVAALALSAAVSLILLTSYLHRTTVDLEAGLHSVRLAEEMQIDLLTYSTASDEITRGDKLFHLRTSIVEAQKYAGVPEEISALGEAAGLIERLSREDFSAESHGADLERAFMALRRFVDVNVRQAETSLNEAARWDKIGDYIGIGVAALLTIGTAAVLSWLSVIAFRPVFEIRDAMKDFAAGRKDARAPEHGPEELRSIAAQFNRMAASLVRQHENQLAFLAAVAHDLRNPLNALKLSSEILSLGGTISQEKISSVMEIIGRQVRHLDRMVGDLLDSTRIEAGRLEVRFEDCDARKIIRDAFDLFSSASSKHQFTLKLTEEEVPLRCDPLRIGQVVNNLLSNAIKYSPAGGAIQLILEHSDDRVQICVSDEGMGIANEELPYIFEPFRRSGTSREEIPGVGLGLSVAQRIVQAHGGWIQAESDFGKGTRFRVHLHKDSRTVTLKRAV